MGKEREMGWMENEQHKEENRSSSVFFLEEMLVDVGQGGGTTTAHTGLSAPRSFAFRCCPCDAVFCVVFCLVVCVVCHVVSATT